MGSSVSIAMLSDLDTTSKQMPAAAAAQSLPYKKPQPLRNVSQATSPLASSLVKSPDDTTAGGVEGTNDNEEALHKKESSVILPTHKHIAVKDAYEKMHESLNDPNMRMKESLVSADDDLFGSNRVRVIEPEGPLSLSTAIIYAKHIFKQKVGTTDDISLDDFKDILTRVLTMFGMPAANITMLVDAILQGIRMQPNLERVDLRQLVISINSMHEDLGAFPQLMEV